MSVKGMMKDLAEAILHDPRLTADCLNQIDDVCVLSVVFFFLLFYSCNVFHSLCCVLLVPLSTLFRKGIPL